MTWVDTPLKRLFSSVTGGAWGVDPEDGELILPCIRGTDFDQVLLRTDLSRAPLRGFRKAEVAMRAARQGDLIIEKSGGGEQQPVGRVVLHSLEKLVMPTNFAGRLRPEPGTDPRFACYLLSSLYHDGRTRAAIKQTTGIQNLDIGEFISFRIKRPTLREQLNIADFLDSETARIDALIAKKQQLISLTSGRVKTVMESLIWADAFDQLQLRRVARFIDYRGATPSKATSGVSLITASHVRDGILDMETDPQWISQDIYKVWMRRGFPSAGDVLLTTEAPLGNVAQIAEPSVALAQRVILLKPDTSRILPDFLAYSLRTSSFQESLRSQATGSTALGIKADRLKALKVPIPSLEVQNEIISSIRKADDATNCVKRKLERQMGLLQEHRQALITAAVTGELEVSERPGVDA